MRIILFLLLLPVVSRSQPILVNLTGGTTNQYLKKASNADCDYVWTTISGGGDLLAANNLSDLINAATARTNLSLGNVTNESKATMFTSPTFTGAAVLGTPASGTLTNCTFPVMTFANGGISAAAATSATTGTMTVSMTTSVITITPTGACTFNASGGVAGQKITFAVTTSGTTSFVLTFGTNFRKVGTLATGTVSARFFSVTFICINGTIWQEIGRTAAQT